MILKQFNSKCFILNLVTDSSSIGSRDTKCENLINGLTGDREALSDERVQLKINSSLLTKEVKDLQSQCNALRDERDRLKTGSSDLAKEKLVLQTQCNNLRDEREQLRADNRNLTVRVEVLQSQYNDVTASRDKLQEEVNRLNLNRTSKKCTSAAVIRQPITLCLSSVHSLVIDESNWAQ